MPNSLAIIGAGRVGRALGRRLRELGWKIGAVVTRSDASARRAVRFIGAGKACGGMTRQILASRVILIATPDDKIAVVAQELARIGEEELRGRVVLHTSGAMDSGVLDALQTRGATVGSMHPLQSFSGVAVPSLEGKVFTIEGETHAVRVARQIARALGGSPVLIAGSRKILYHAAAAMAAGHVLALAEAAMQLLLSLGMSRSEAARGVDGSALSGRLQSGAGAFGRTSGIAGRICPGLRCAESSGRARPRKRCCRDVGRIGKDFPGKETKSRGDRGQCVKRLQIRMESTKLANGLNVVVAPDTTAPVVTVGVYYKIGFRLEPRGRSGFAHLFEHMMFQGSANAPKMQHIKLVNSSGGVLNGSTSYDVTNYYEAVPSNALERVLWLEADRMRALKVDDENLKNQRDVVKEEVRVNVM